MRLRYALSRISLLVLLALESSCQKGSSGLKVDLGDTKEMVRNEYGGPDVGEATYGRMGLGFEYDEGGKIRIIRAFFHNYGEFRGELAGVSLGMPLETAIKRLGKPLEVFGERLRSNFSSQKLQYAVWRLGSSRFLFVGLFTEDTPFNSLSGFGQKWTLPRDEVFRKNSIFEIKLCNFRCEELD